MTNLLQKLKGYLAIVWGWIKIPFQDSPATKRANEIEKLEAIKTKIKLRKPKVKKKKAK